MSKPSVAILGASADRSKFGNKSLRAHVQAGYDVYPVNPKSGTIEDLTVYRSLADLPLERLQRVSVYLPPEVGLRVLDEIAAKARKLGLHAIAACSIVDLGLSPAQFP